MRCYVVVEDVVRCLCIAWYARGKVTVVHIVMGTRYDIFAARASPTKKGQYLYRVQRLAQTRVLSLSVLRTCRVVTSCQALSKVFSFV